MCTRSSIREGAKIRKQSKAIRKHHARVLLYAGVQISGMHLLDKSVDSDPIRVIPNQYPRAIGGQAHRNGVDSSDSPR
jgi:hypothetical protein